MRPWLVSGLRFVAIVGLGACGTEVGGTEPAISSDASDDVGEASGPGVSHDASDDVGEASGPGVSHDASDDVGEASGPGVSHDASDDVGEASGPGVSHDASDDVGEAAGGSCVNGATCSPNGCQSGTTSCASGIAECVSLVNVPAGTPCGTNQVCNQGTCVACGQGLSCSPPGNFCETGITSCSTGAPVCAQLANVANGTPCGTNEVCFDGTCLACTSGVACNPNGNVCETGTTSCGATGQPTCVLTGDLPDGTACGSNETCSRGLCTSCQAGAACVPGNPPNVCQTGITSCATGQATCTVTGNMANGSACNTSGMCIAGACSSCTPGEPCSLPGNTCQTGVTACNGNQETCTTTNTAADGTSCGAGGICCGGSCATCSTGVGATNACSPSGICEVTCNQGLSLCGGQCVDTTTNAGACGGACRPCPVGSACVASQCVAEYGFPPPATCSTNFNKTLIAGEVVSQRVSLPVATSVTGLGIIGNPGGGSVFMAVYSDTDGSPTIMEFESQEVIVGSGINVVPVAPPQALLAGTYWIMAEVNATSNVCVDSSTTNTILTGLEPFGTFPGNWGTVSSLDVYTNTVDYNFFFVAND